MLPRVTAEKLGHLGARLGVEGGEPPLQRRIERRVARRGHPRLRLVERRYEPARGTQPGAGGEAEELRPRVRSVDRVEEEIEEAGRSHPPLHLLAAPYWPVAPQRVGVRQRGEQRACVLHSRLLSERRAAVGSVARRVEEPQHRLGFVDSGTAERSVHHQRQAAAGLEGRRERTQRGQRIARVVHDAHTVDVIEGTEAEPRQLLE